MNYPTHEQEPGADPAPAMDDMPTTRGGGGEARGGGGHRADAGPELTRRAVGPRLYHKKSRMGCLRCKARRVKVSYLLCYAPLCYATRSSRVGCVTNADGGYYICTSYYSSRDLVDLLLLITRWPLRSYSLAYRTSFNHLVYIGAGLRYQLLTYP